MLYVRVMFQSEYVDEDAWEIMLCNKASSTDSLISQCFPKPTLVASFLGLTVQSFSRPNNSCCSQKNTKNRARKYNAYDSYARN